MPSAEYTTLSDEDLGAMIAYLKTIPAVDRERGPLSPGPVIRALMVAGQVKLAAEVIDHAAHRPASVEKGITVAHGRYLAAGCTGCHGENLSGGKIPGAPPDWPATANLTPHTSSRLPAWSEQQFLATLRTQKRPDGTALHPLMPAAIGQMTDEEIDLPLDGDPDPAPETTPAAAEARAEDAEALPCGFPSGAAVSSFPIRASQPASRRTSSRPARIGPSLVGALPLPRSETIRHGATPVDGRTRSR